MLISIYSKEWLDGDNKYKCDGCNDYVLAWKRLNIHMAPNVLTIALKRFQSGRFGKLNKRATFPETLDLSPYISESADGNDKYKLYAAVVHVDMLNASYFGHYICYTKDFSGNWYRIDDCKVDAVELDEVLSQGAYMLLYSRVFARQSCLNPIEETSRNENPKTSNGSQPNIPIVSPPGECSLAAESVDTTEKCDTVMHANELLENISTSQNPSDTTVDQHTAESNPGSSVLEDNGNCDNDRTVAIEDDNCFTENEDGTKNPVSIESDVGDDNIEGNIVISPFSSTNGEQANGVDSVILECKPESAMEDESEKPVKTSSSVKLKPLISPGFLGKRPRKIVNTKKDENAPEQVNGDVVVVNGGVGKEE